MRTRPLRFLSVVAVASILVGSGVAHAAEAGTDRCSRDDKVVAENGSFVVVERRNGPVAFFVCPRATSQRKLLGPFPGSFGDLDLVDLDRFRLSDRYVAYQYKHVPWRERTRFTVVVRDGRTGKLLRRAEAFEAVGPRRPSSSRDGVRDLVVNDAGQVAWIVQNPTAEKYLQEVRSLAADGSQVILDQGNAIKPDSLSLDTDGRTITWTKAGRRKSGSLPPSSQARAVR